MELKPKQKTEEPSAATVRYWSEKEMEMRREDENAK